MSGKALAADTSRNEPAASALPLTFKKRYLSLPKVTLPGNIVKREARLEIDCQQTALGVEGLVRFFDCIG